MSFFRIENYKAIPGILGVACVFMGTLTAMDCYGQDNGNQSASVVRGVASIKGETPAYLVNDSISTEITRLEKEGRLTDAMDALDKTSNVDPQILKDEKSRLQYLKREFSVTPEEMLKKIQARIPDATQAELHDWSLKHEIFWISVDGETRYFRREPGILLRLNKEAKARAEAHDSGDPAGRSAREFSFTDHLTSALTKARADNTSVVLPVRFKVTHNVSLKPGRVPAGEIVRCWLPYPREDVRQQSNIKLVSMMPEGKVASDSDSPQRTVYFEKPAANDGSATFSLTFEYTGAAFVPDLSKARPQLSDSERNELADYLGSRKPHLEQTDAVKKQSKEIVGDKTAIVDKAYAVWDWVEASIPWCPEMEYSVMSDIVDKVLTERRGDCGTQALTFIALARAAGVPARWQSGWVTKPGGWNMHDWAEFYAPGIGWVPVDPSVGRQESGDPAVKEFLFGHVDAYRMIANSDYGSQFSPAKTHLRSDPVDNQRGEMEWSGGNLYYDDWSYDVNVDIK